MKKINYKSDFDAVLRLKDAAGKEVPFPDCDWEAVFWTFSKSRVFRASCIGGECVNCIREKDGSFRVVFNGHGIGVGILRWEPHFKLPDTLFPDGVRDIYVPQPLDIELVTGAGDYPTTAEVEASLPLIKGDKGERGERGEKGERGERGERGEKGEKGDGFTFADFSPEQIADLQRPATEAAESVSATEADVKAAEALRVSAESAREAAEQSRAAEESARQTAESLRADAESSRNLAESSRESAEAARESAEAARAASYATIEQRIDTRVNDVLRTVNTVAQSVSDETTRAETAEATKQDKLSVSEDLALSEENVLSLTDIAKMRLFIDLFNAAAGRAGHAEIADGKFSCSLNGLALTYAEAIAILDAGHVSLDYATARFSGFKGRTVLPLTRGIDPGSKYLFHNAVYLEVIDVDLMPVDDGTFKGCSSLVRIKGVLQWNKLTKQSFAGCAALEEISDLRINTATVNLSESPALTLQTLTSMVQKCTAKSCTVTVHADVYAKLTDETNTEWHAVLTAAAAKNITFATT